MPEREESKEIGMWRHLVVYLPGVERAPALLAVGAQLAAAVPGRLRGLFVKRLPLMEYSFLPPAPELSGPPPGVYDAELWAEVENQQEQTAQALLELFDRQAGPARLGLEVAVGLVVEELLRAGRSADLLILGREELLGAGLKVSDTGAVLLKQSWAPVWVAAPEVPIKGPVLVAYDGSLAANRALRQVAAWAERTQAPVTIACFGEAEETANLLAEAQQYLLPYELQLTLISRPGKPVAGLTALLTEDNYSLTALGAHGQSKLKDLLLGTTTETLLSQNFRSHFLVCT